MINSEINLTPEFNEQSQNREILIKIAQELLLDQPLTDVDVNKLSDREIGEYILVQFQKNLENYVESSGLSKEIQNCKDDEELLHLIANKSEGVHGWMDMLPNLAKLEPKAGMNCTMGSVALHVGLKSLNYQNVRTVVVKGHSIVLRELEDGSIKLYDPNSKSTVNDKLVGYTHTFKAEQITNRAEVEERSGRKGFKFTLERGEQDEQGGFHMADEDGKFIKHFYAYDQSILMDLSVALGNLNEIKHDAKELGGVEGLPLIDRNEYLKALVGYIKRNNTGELQREDFRAIERTNPGVVDKILAAAEKSFLSGDEPPNPFNFFNSDLLNPKKDLGLPPLTSLFAKDATERHEHAKQLLGSYPELENLDFDTMNKQFDLFTADPYIE